MAAIINADDGVISGASGLKLSSDTSGALNIQTNGVTAIAISASQAVSFPATTSLNFTSANITTLTSSSATITNLLATSLTVSSGSTLNGGVVINEPGADADTRIEGDTDANLFFADASTDRIGVGTSSPTAKLHVWQTGAATSLNIDGIENPIFAARYAANADGATVFLAKSRNATVGSHTIVQSGDELGVIKARGSNGTSFEDAAAIYFNVDGTPGSSGDMPGRIVFGTAADGTASITERARITSGGNLLVGSTSTPTPLNAISGIAAAKLLTATDGSTPTQVSGAVIFGGGTGSPNAGRVFFGDNTGWEWEWGYVNSTNTYGRRFYFTDGGAAYSSTGTWGTISDESLKQDISYSSSQWNDIKSIKFRKYRFKKEVAENENAPFMLGVVAQEIEQTSPNLVYTSKIGEKSVKTSVLLMKAAVALQEAMLRIEQLESKVSQLEVK